MKMRITLAALAVASLPFGAMAASFEAPQPYQILLVDGKKTDHSAMHSVNEVELKAGKHQFAISYTKDYSTRTDIQVLDGDPVIVTLDVPEDAQLTLDYKAPVNYQAAREFLRDQSGKIRIVDQNTGQPVEAELYTIHRPAGMDVARGIQDYLEETGKSFGGRTDAALVAAEAQFGDASVNADTLDMLKHWWKAADKDTRRAFQIWMIQQQ